MGQFWLAARLVHSVVLVLFLVHAGTLLRQFPQHVHLALDKLRRFSRMCVMAGNTASTDEIDEMVKHGMAKTRLRSAKFAIGILAPVIGFTMVLGCVWVEMIMADGVNIKFSDVFGLPYLLSQMLGCILYLMVLLMKVNVLVLTLARVQFAYSLVMAYSIIRVALESTNPTFFVLAAFRMTVRIAAGLVLLDWRRASFWNVLLSLATCSKVWHNTGVCVAGFDSSGFVWFVQEIWVLGTTLAALYCAEEWQLSYIRASVIARTSEAARQAVHTMLSVLCDSVVHLGPDGSIVRNAPELAQLLGITAADDIRNLLGNTLLQYIKQEDRQRFLELIASTQQATSSVQPVICAEQQSQLAAVLETSSAQPGGPPAAVHVHMSSPSRPAFLVDLFAVHFQGVNGPAGHLIGIREAIDYEAGAAVPELSAPSLTDANDVLQMVANEARARHESGLSKPSSRTSSESLNAVGLLKLTSVALEIDVSSGEAEVHTCTLSLAPSTCSVAEASTAAALQQRQQGSETTAHEAVQESSCAPRRCLRLADLLQSPNPFELKRWIQKQANALAAGGTPVYLGGIQLQLCEPRFSMNLELEASRGSLSFLQLSHDESDEESAETKPGPAMELPMLLQLEGLSKQRRRHRRHRGGSAGSNQSRRSRSSRCPSLPGIEEHPDVGQEDEQHQRPSTGRLECRRGAVEVAGGSRETPSSHQRVVQL